MQNKRWLPSSLWAAFAALSVMLCAELLLRNLSLFLQFDPQFSAIFAQIAHGRIGIPVGLLAVLAVAFWLLLRSGRGMLPKVLTGLLLWLLGFAAALLLTRVNGIRFCDVLFSLLDVMKKGGL